MSVSGINKPASILKTDPDRAASGYARFTPASLIDVAALHLAGALVDDANRAQLRAIAAAVPSCVRSLGFECRLASDPTVDLGCSVSRQSAGAAVLARTRPHADSPDRESWLRLGRFAAAWLDPASPLAVRVPFLFLEFDGGEPADGTPVPAVFLGVDWPIDELNPTGRQRARRGFDAVVAAAGTLRSSAWAPEVLAAAKHGFSALPDGAVLLHAGVMLSRPGESLRLSAAVPRIAVPAYLEAVRRTTCVPAVSAALDRYADVSGFAHSTSHVQLDFDLGGADARLGVTLCPPRRELWPRLLAALGEDGLCERDKALGLLRWVGDSVERLEPALPPCLVRRRIEHVKLVFAPELVGAKAYFGATPEWSER